VSGFYPEPIFCAIAQSLAASALLPNPGPQFTFMPANGILQGQGQLVFLRQTSAHRLSSFGFQFSRNVTDEAEINDPGERNRLLA
jgi:hypothetical protein